MLDFETARRRVCSGESGLFEMWRREDGIQKPVFLDGLFWLCQDQGITLPGGVWAPARALGSSRSSGLVRLSRDSPGPFRDRRGRPWGRKYVCRFDRI